MTRLVGWTRALCLYIEPGLTRLVGVAEFPDAESERKHMEEKFRAYLDQKTQDLTGSYSEQLLGRLAPKLGDEYLVVAPDCTAVLQPGLARLSFPDVFERTDKDGLLPLASLNAIGPGVFERNGLVLFAHEFFRRSLSRLNGLNNAFLAALQQLATERSLRVRLALDEDLVGLAESYKAHMEFVYWWGPHFSDNLEGIPEGVCVHKASESLRAFHGISKCEFRWYRQGGRKAFECEEIRDMPSLGISVDRYGCRFVHSLVDEGTRSPTHVDGAIRMYDSRSMQIRCTSDIAKAGRHTEYCKLWRVDGTLGVAKWKELVSHYFRDNRLVGEYFGGRDESEAVKASGSDRGTPRGLTAQYVPYRMDKGHGARLSVAYYPARSHSRGQCCVESADTIQLGPVTRFYVEADTVEVIKILRRMGQDVCLDGRLAFVAFEDKVVNLPVIMHHGCSAVALAANTQRAIARLCSAWSGRQQERLLAYSIAIDYGDRCVHFSVAGHVSDINEWCSHEAASFPESANGMRDWCERASRALRQMGAAERNAPPLYELLQETGLLRFRRRSLDPGHYSIQIEQEGSEPRVVMSLPTDEAEAIRHGELAVGWACILHSTVCSRCHKEYLTCDCCKTVDDDIGCYVKAFDLLDLFWTDRPA